MTLGEKITKLRESNNLTQKQLAEELQVSTGMIAEWESDEAAPSLSDIAKLCSVFDVTTDSLLMETTITEPVEPKVEIKEKPAKKKSKRPLIIIAIILSVVLIVGGIIAFLFIPRDATPKIDEFGNPVFVEFTDEVYTNAKNYLGYYVTIKGKVFQNLGDNGTEKGLQAWIDPDNCEQNVMIYYTTDVTFKDGDYVYCTGYIKNIKDYTNAYGGKLDAPVIYSTNLRASDYIEVVSPTQKTVKFGTWNQTLCYEDYGYKVELQKVEYADNETRLYMKVTNNGKETLSIDINSSIVIQDGKQYNQKDNFQADYDEIPSSIAKGSSVEGIVTFPGIKMTKFNYIVNIHTKNTEEKMGKVTFSIGKNIVGEDSSVVPPEYPSVVGVWEYQSRNYLCRLQFFSNGTWREEYIDNTNYNSPDPTTPFTGTWTQSKDNLIYYMDEPMWNDPFYTIVGEDQLEFLDDWYTRVQ